MLAEPALVVEYIAPRLPVRLKVIFQNLAQRPTGNVEGGTRNVALDVPRKPYRCHSDSAYSTDELFESGHETLELRPNVLVHKVACLVEYLAGARDEKARSEPRTRPQRAQHREPCTLREDRSPRSRVAPISATGRSPNTRAMSFAGRDSQSIAFLKTPGSELLYSGVTSRSPLDEAIRSLSF